MEVGDVVERKEIEEDGWNEIESFADNCLIFMRGFDRILWCKGTKEIIASYRTVPGLKIAFVDEFSDE